MGDYKFDLQNYLKELEYLVNIDSGSRNPRGISKVADFFIKKYLDIGYSVKTHEINEEIGPCLEIENCSSERYDILLLGHMDTVFEIGTAKERPFTIIDNRAYGPGVIDMKSGLLSMYYALKEIYEKELGKNLSIKIILNSDEEIGSRGSLGIISRAAVKSNVVFVLEPARANGALVLQRKGLGAYDIKFHGIAAHAGVEPQKGASAITEMGRWIVELNILNNYKAGTTVNVGIASGGTARNVVAEEAKIQVDLRFKEIAEMNGIDKAIEDLISNPIIKGVKVDVNKLGMRPPMNPMDTTMKIWSIIKEIGHELGIELDWVATGGGSDANITASLGVPSIDGLGPIGGGAHGQSEYLEIDSIQPRLEVLKKLILSPKLSRLF
ncbi:MAG: M20 family metallopeptidase [Clostridia bacterium]|nr:M20 family metallopeptidase [Clostridia bacterium]